MLVVCTVFISAVPVRRLGGNPSDHHGRLKITQTLLEVKRICSSISLSYLDVAFTASKKFFTSRAACCLVRLLLSATTKICFSPWTLRWVVRSLLGDVAR